MSFRFAKVLSSPALMLIIAAALLICSARGAIADAPIQDNYFQILQSAKPFLSPAGTKPSIAQLQSLLDAAQKYFSTKRQYEQSLFNQSQERQFNSGGIFTQEPLPKQTPSVQSILIEVFQNAISTQAIKAASLADLIHLRDLLRQLKTLDQGHLSGMVWLYDSPFPGFAEKHLAPINALIIDKSLASAAALRKKHQYAAAQKIYKNLLADYADTADGARVKVLLQAAIVEDFNYQAKAAFAKHDYKKGRAALMHIVALFPDTDYSRQAQAAIDKAVSVSVKYFRSQGDELFHPEGNIGVPQSKARLYYSLMYESNPQGSQADYAYYYWCEALGTEGKTTEALAKLKQFPVKFPRSKLLPKAYFLTGFLLGAAPLCRYDEAAVWLEMVVRQFKKSQEGAEAVWYLAFFADANGDASEVKKWLEQLSQNYPKSPRVTAARQWLGNLKREGTR